MKKFKEYLLENDIKTHHYSGTSVSSFDKNGENSTKGFPYRSTSDFDDHEEKSHEVSKDEFLKHANVHPKLNKILNNKNTIFLHDRDKDVHMMYDTKNVHHLYTKNG